LDEEVTAPIKYHVWTSTPDGSSREELSGSFGAAESRVMAAFLDHSDRLARTEVMALGTDGELSIHLDHVGDISATLPA
jgi:hypothetical protein